MKLKVMTFNIRVESQQDGINYLPNRYPRILETIARESPDLIGFQEVSDASRRLLRRELSPEYTVVGCGRTLGFRGESCCLAYRNDCFELISLHTEFLSDTPDEPGTYYRESDQSKCPRLFVDACLSHAEQKKPIHFINTHLDHRGEISRLLGMTQIVQRISGQDGYFVLTGDMNARPTEPCIRLPLSSIPNTQDATADIAHSFHGFGKHAEHDEGVKIDYIFTNALPLESRAVADIPQDGLYTSDHFPLCAIIDFPSREE